MRIDLFKYAPNWKRNYKSVTEYGLNTGPVEVWKEWSLLSS
jgi:hypothetical protein